MWEYAYRQALHARGAPGLRAERWQPGGLVRIMTTCLLHHSRQHQTTGPS